jgi:division protein CdvB (Snf7/Vps24/ESCRT-III family)
MPNLWRRLVKEGFLSKYQPLAMQLAELTAQIRTAVSKLNLVIKKLDEQGSRFSNLPTRGEIDLAISRAIERERTESENIKQLAREAMLTLEEAEPRLGTIRELGELTMTLFPGNESPRNVNDRMNSFVHEPSAEIWKVPSLLNEILTSTVIGYPSLDPEISAVLERAEEAARNQGSADTPTHNPTMKSRDAEMT